MTKDKCNLFGFLIEPDIHVDLRNNRVVRIRSDKLGKNFMCAIVTLKEVTMSIFSYLLCHAGDGVVTRKALMMNVLDEMRYASSSQLLSHELKELRMKLELIGIAAEQIITSKSDGIILSDIEVSPLYY